ncbi:MAG: restriction endonuclease subunit S [Lachnospiraceae bacterium]|nr:restriction endonuclease subunit S [Lachnospiraceae bacterium]
MGEWVEKRISEIALVTMGQSPTSDSYNENGDGLPFLQGNRTFGAKYPTFDTFTTAPNKIADANDVIMSVRAPVGDLNITPVKMCLGRGVCSLKPQNGNFQFLFYLMKCHVPIMLSRSNGTVYDSINRTDIEKTKVLVPANNSTQARIAEILSTYDDAIENNNRRIALLEKAARELYREWFVRMRFPGHEGVKIVNGLPDEWEVKRLGEFCHVTDGTHDTPKQTDMGVPLVTGKHIKNGFIDFDSAYLISEADHIAISRRSGLNFGDILLSNIGTVGSICVVDYDREFSVKNVIILKPKCVVKTAYLYYLMTSPAIQDILSVQTNGASQQFVGLTFMRRFKILVPSEPILDSFAKYITPILTEKQKLHKQAQNLARQRDLLLPRLMSGKMEV